MDKYLQDKGFKKNIVDNNLYIKFEGDDLLIVLVYVDDIIFGSTNDSFVLWFANTMKFEFEMSMIGELSLFLGLQITQTAEGLFLSQKKYFRRKYSKGFRWKILHLSVHL